MKRFSAQYIITNSGLPLKRGIVTTDDSGLIISVEDTGGFLKEEQSIEFHNGIIIPGLINSHCHLELSHMKGKIAPGAGLGDFLFGVRDTREADKEEIQHSISKADNEMYMNGVVLCADICNNSSTFGIKKESRIKYINLLEVFGVDTSKADKRMNEISSVAVSAEEEGIKWSFTPHSAYSMSVKLLRLVKEKSKQNTLSSIHFMETPGEKPFLENRTGALADSYQKAGLLSIATDMALNSADVILNEVTASGNLVLVHNTFTERQTIREVKKRKDLYWCLCPGSNLYIENEMPPVNLLREENCELIIGTDSLASNRKLDILGEMKTLQQNFPELSIEDLVKWATLNGAKALGEEGNFGTLEPGKRPGLILLQNVDLQNMKLKAESSVKRLI